jgi:hypothetical protein
MDQKAISGKALNCCSMLDSGSDGLIDFILSRLWGFMEIKSSLDQMFIIYTIQKTARCTRGGGAAGRRAAG